MQCCFFMFYLNFLFNLSSCNSVSLLLRRIFQLASHVPLSFPSLPLPVCHILEPSSDTVFQTSLSPSNTLLNVFGLSRVEWGQGSQNLIPHNPSLPGQVAAPSAAHTHLHKHVYAHTHTHTLFLEKRSEFLCHLAAEPLIFVLSDCSAGYLSTFTCRFWNNLLCKDTLMPWPICSISALSVIIEQE